MHQVPEPIGKHEQEQLGNEYGLRLEVIYLSKDSTERGESETEDGGAKSNGL